VQKLISMTRPKISKKNELKLSNNEAQLILCAAYYRMYTTLSWSKFPTYHPNKQTFHPFLLKIVSNEIFVFISYSRSNL